MDFCIFPKNGHCPSFFAKPNVAYLLSILIILCWGAFAQVSVHSGWGEELEVRVLDSYNRPIPGVLVNVTWPINSMKWGVTKTLPTNEFGRVYYSISTYEFIPSKVIYTFYINASYNGKKISSQFDHRIGSQPRTLWFDAYRVNLITTDQNGKPLSLDVVADGEIRAKTNEYGWAQLILLKGSHTIVATHQGREHKMQINVSNDSTFTMVFPLYNARIRVIDDFGNPLRISLNIGSEAYSPDSQGYVYLYNFTDPKIAISAFYGNLKKSVDMDLSVLNQTVIVFDTHPPLIELPQSIYNGTTLVISAVVNDKGDFASGMSSEQASVMLQYSLPDSPQPKVIPMYAVGYNKFQAAIPIKQGSPNIRYTIIATDAEGNQAQSSDVFNIALPPSENKTQSAISAVSPSPDIASQVWWALLLPIIVVIGGAYWYYISRRPPSESMQQDLQYHYKGEDKAEDGQKKPGLSLPFGKPKPPEIPKSP